MRMRGRAGHSKETGMPTLRLTTQRKDDVRCCGCAKAAANGGYLFCFVPPGCKQSAWHKRAKSDHFRRPGPFGNWSSVAFRSSKWWLLPCVYEMKDALIPHGISPRWNLLLVFRFSFDVLAVGVSDGLGTANFAFEVYERSINIPASTSLAK